MDLVVLSQLSVSRATGIKLLTVPPTFTIAIALFGFVFANPGGAENLRSAVGPVVIVALLIAQLASSAFLVWQVRGCRALMMTVSILALLGSLWALFLSYMSVTGDWL